jgi:glutaredoxin
MEMMSDALIDFLDREMKVNPYTYVPQLMISGGNVGLARELDEISSRLHLECAWLKRTEYEHVS